MEGAKQLLAAAGAEAKRLNAPSTIDSILINTISFRVVVRKDPAINKLMSNNPKIWKLAEGFKFSEGPLWVPAGTLPCWA